MKQYVIEFHILNISVFPMPHEDAMRRMNRIMQDYNIGPITFDYRNHNT